MIREMLLLFGCTLLAWIYQNSKVTDAGIVAEKEKKYNETIISKILFAFLCFVMVCHSGLRTHMNDTWTYISSFNSEISSSLSAIKQTDWSIGANPFFYIYRILLKHYVSGSGQTFIFISSLIPVVLYLLYIRKHAESFSLTIYVFIAFCAYGFTMVAIKQSIATSIALWAVDYFLEKKYIRGVVILTTAMLFHPYAVVFISLPFLYKGIWDLKTVLIILLTGVCGFTFSRFANLITSLAASAFEDTYNVDYFFEDSGLKTVRFFVYAAVPLLSFVFRDNLKSSNNKFGFLCVNASIISACFVFVGLSGGGILLGRMANYFDVFICLAASFIIHYGIKDYYTKSFVAVGMAVCFCIYYYVYNWKYYPEWSGDMYQHISFFELLRNWR